MSTARIQLCGPLVARVDGHRLEHDLPGRQGRLLFAFLVLERRGPVPRERLVEVLWDDDPPEAADSALSALLSRLRRVVPVEGRSSVSLVLPAGAWIDVEVAREALHRAEGAVGRRAWAEAWGPARVAQHVAERPFLPADPSVWANERRRDLEDVLLRALELAGTASLGIGGGEVATAERAARRLVALAPLRESGARLLMDVLDRRGNRAEALLVYDGLRTRLRDEVGVAPSPETQALHRAIVRR